MARNPKIINMYHNAKLVVDVLPRPLRFTAPLLEKLSVSLSDVVIGCSETTLDGLFNGWREHQNYSALYLGIPLARFQQPIFPLKIKSALGIPNDSPVVGHIGRFAPQKNHEAFVLVAQTLVNKLNDFHFLLVGDGPLRNKIENQVDALGLSGNFHFTGIRHDIPDLISAMDLAFFPSLIEGSPVTFIEAQVAGLPVVTVDRPELREAICPENHTQLIVPIDEPELAANRIHQLLMNPSLLEVISRRGSQWATNRFSIEKSTIELENIINNAVAQS
jgi:glycosyltransferase involved in cell wall biosynthesis